jgi:hypothetical protein
MLAIRAHDKHVLAPHRVFGLCSADYTSWSFTITTLCSARASAVYSLHIAYHYLFENEALEKLHPISAHVPVSTMVIHTSHHQCGRYQVYAFHSRDIMHTTHLAQKAFVRHDMNIYHPKPLFAAQIYPNLAHPSHS